MLVGNHLCPQNVPLAVVDAGQAHETGACGGVGTVGTNDQSHGDGLSHAAARGQGDDVVRRDVSDAAVKPQLRPVVPWPSRGCE